MTHTEYVLNHEHLRTRETLNLFFKHYDEWLPEIKERMKYWEHLNYVRLGIHNAKSNRAFVKCYEHEVTDEDAYSAADIRYMAYYFDIIDNPELNKDILADFQTFGYHYQQDKRDLAQYLCFEEMYNAPHWYRRAAIYWYEDNANEWFDLSGFTTVYELLCDEFSHYVTEEIVA